MNKKHSTLFRISAFLILTLLLTSSLTGCFIKQGELTNDIYITKDSVVTQLAEDKSIPAFNTTTFANVEICFNQYYYTELPSNDTLYSGTKEAFNKFCSDVDKIGRASCRERVCLSV